MNIIIEAIKESLRDMPLELSEEDILILSEWGYGLYKDGWNNAKVLLKSKK